MPCGNEFHSLVICCVAWIPSSSLDDPYSSARGLQTMHDFGKEKRPKHANRHLGFQRKYLAFISAVFSLFKMSSSETEAASPLQCALGLTVPKVKGVHPLKSSALGPSFFSRRPGRGHGSKSQSSAHDTHKQQMELQWHYPDHHLDFLDHTVTRTTLKNRFWAYVSPIIG